MSIIFKLIYGFKQNYTSLPFSGAEIYKMILKYLRKYKKTIENRPILNRNKGSRLITKL